MIEIACANCGLWACICVEGIWLCLSCAYARRMRAVPRFLTVEDLSRAKDFPSSADAVDPSVADSGTRSTRV